jgi:hypothetical protein
MVETKTHTLQLMDKENSEAKFVPLKELKDYIEPHLLDENVRAVKIAQSFMSSRN